MMTSMFVRSRIANRSQAGIQIGAVVNMRDSTMARIRCRAAHSDQTLYVSAAGGGFARVREGAHFCQKERNLAF